jgi:hypothetical protein
LFWCYTISDSLWLANSIIFIFYQPKKFSSICDKNEDQDGFLSPPEVFQCTQHLFVETQRREVLGARLLGVNGKVQRDGAVIHLLAEQLEDLSGLLGRLSTASRDFH